ncbi:MAG TPA: Hsp20/alpha crystallin family protein [Candidatus Eisenbacteria bacterium]|nr:Hsp20/alpha crystallin family protein [Candidatus Eisenbacteria bacterium]
MSPEQNDPFELVQREVERLWRDLVYHRHPGAHFAQLPWAPPADVVVSEDSARVILELAGIPRDAVRVRLEGRMLIVSGRRVPPHELHGAHYHRAEIYFGTFERALELPWEADPNGIQAHYRDGMLEIRIRSAAGRVKDVPIHEGADPAKPR